MGSDRKTLILSAARQLFQEKGLGMSTMEDVAKAAGMGKSSLYYYFKSQEEIFDAVLEAEVGEILQESIRQMSRKNGLSAKLSAFANVKFEMARKRKFLYRATEAGIDAETLSRYQSLKKMIHKRYLQKETILLQQLFVTACAEQEIRELSREALDNAVFVFLAALRGINREITLHWTADEAPGRLAALCEIFYKGLL
ncbi:TetR/AcrR family transcriptional regulator [Mucilaginibacter jinjuensis]|uniref:Helix-turn-helix domain containing protein n=1 Tax=Mucilaginibacter jinjuensis TaxID=1176721 RepID=A0ABY7TA07_9SPHI|nr:TetR/AcrR family transcriptional regulator [Mucilaginibacter jinjuensis]WCT13246.1 helix-turn-helix domain containing protein [Mucilaginibacter jinjuensis]